MIAWMFLLAAAAQSPDSAAKATETLAASCLDRKFETTVRLTGRDGKPRASKVKLCGKPGQNDSDWLATLRDAVDKVVVDPKMSNSAKDQVITALNAEIARLEPLAKAQPDAAPAPAAPPAPVAVTPAPITAIPTIAAPAPLLAAPELDRAPQYSTYSPLPAPKPVAPVVTGTAAAVPVALPTLPAPRLTFRCTSVNTIGVEGPCDLLEREMLLTVRADENLPGGTSLRFLRRGDNRAEVALLTLRRGQTQRFSLPARVCQGVSGSRVEIQVVRAANAGPQVVDTRGPFELRC